MGKANRHARRQKRQSEGRPSGLTADVHARIVAGAKAGVPVTFLGPLVGVSSSCVMKWLATGKRNGGGPHFQLFTAVKQAQAEYVQSCLGEIRTAAPKSWQAAAWLLERMHRDEFGGDKLELNQLKKELKELRQLLVKVPRDTGEAAAETGGETEGRGDGPADGPAANP